MHDPLTVAFEIRRPWREKPSQFWPDGYRPSWVTIWHRDPERDGSDDSCDWSGRKRKLDQYERGIIEAMWDLETLLDNRPHYPDSPEHKAFQHLKAAIWEWRRRHGWRWHPRWHFWHWQVQIHPWQALRRWLFSRCARCGKRFPYGYSPVSFSWHSPKPRWFRGEVGVYHAECSNAQAGEADAPSPSVGSPGRTREG